MVSPELPREHMELKQRLYTDLQGDREAYQERKSFFIKEVCSEGWAEHGALGDASKPRH